MRKWVRRHFLPVLRIEKTTFILYNKGCAFSGRFRTLQLRGIHRLPTTNITRSWSEAGGPDAALLPYCRNTDSGSHALMERYFLEDGALSLSPEILQGNVSIAMSSAGFLPLPE